MGEIEINLLGHSVSLVTKYVMCNSETQERYGSGSRNTNWSEETIDKMRAFIESMETDICRDLFSDGSTTSGVVEASSNTSDGIPGL